MFLRSTDELDWDLLVRTNNSLERLSCQDTVCKLFSNLSGRDETVLFVQIVFIEISQALQEFEFKRRRLRPIIHEEGRIFATLSHIQGTKVE